MITSTLLIRPNIMILKKTKSKKFMNSFKKTKKNTSLQLRKTLLLKFKIFYNQESSMIKYLKL